MKILVINAGSSSLKYQLIDMDGEKVLAKGNCERIGGEGSLIVYKTETANIKKKVEMPDHKVAFMQVKDMLLDPENGVIKDLSEVNAVGHRAVQGGSVFRESCLVTPEVIDTIKELSPLAPLHNPANALGIESSKEVFGEDMPQVVVFDTAFHSTMPEKAYMYAVPYEYYEKHGVRRYGFHGTSHRFVSTEMAKRMGKDIKDLKLITCHIGNGSSITAIDGGKVIDTTMGLTPLDGFMMGTRSGSLDPSVVTFIQEKENLSASEVDTILNKKSGLLGISGVSSDDRDITAAEADGNERAKLAHSMLYYQIAKYIGSYYVALGGCDGIVFTAGLGENQPSLRKSVCEYLKCLGVEIDDEANEACIHGNEGKLSSDNSKIRVELVATNEELVIARDTKDIVLASK
ncbi:MAG: acetate kinase [Ruminococcus sp.]|nr:acetate kinase [Ruminococcus sp.]